MEGEAHGYLEDTINYDSLPVQHLRKYDSNESGKEIVSLIESKQPHNPCKW